MNKPMRALALATWVFARRRPSNQGLGQMLRRRRPSFARRAFIFSYVLISSAYAQSSSQERLLSLDLAQTLAVQGSQLVSANLAQSRAAREMQVAAGQLPDPVLKAGVENVPVNGPDQFSVARDFMTQRSIGVMQELTRGDKRSARAARYEQESRAGDAQRRLTIAQIRRDVALSWLERSYRESAALLLDSETREARLQADAADSAYRAGRGSQADVFAARAQVEEIGDRQRQTEQQIAAAVAQLSRWLGEDARLPVSERPAFDSLPLAEQALRDRLEHHPQLDMLESQERVASADVDLARANRRPDWTWELTYSQRGSNYSNMVSLNVSVPVPWNRGHLQDRELGARLAQREQAQAEREDARRALTADAQATVEQWKIARSRLARYDTVLLALAQQRTQAALAAYRGAGTAIAPVLEARRAEVEVALERLNIEQEAARLWVQLNYYAATAP